MLSRHDTNTDGLLDFPEVPLTAIRAHSVEGSVLLGGAHHDLCGQRGQPAFP